MQHAVVPTPQVDAMHTNAQALLSSRQLNKGEYLPAGRRMKLDLPAKQLEGPGFLSRHVAVLVVLA